MPLTISDFVTEADGITLDEIPQDAQDRINQVLADLTEGLDAPTDAPDSGPPETTEVLVSTQLDGRPGFESLQDALDGMNPQNGASGVTPGDRVVVEEGTFEETVSVTTPNVEIRGRGAGTTVIEGRIDVAAAGVTLRETTVRATGDTAVAATVSDGLTLRANAILAREEGVGLRITAAPESGATAVENNTFESLGNETATSFVVLGPASAPSKLGKSLLTDGGSPPPRQVQDANGIQLIANTFTGNVAGEGAVQVQLQEDATVEVTNNDFSETLLFDADATPVSNSASGAVTVETSNNQSPTPVSQDQGISIDGEGIVQTANLTGAEPLPGLEATQLAESLVPDGDLFFAGLYFPTVVDEDDGVPVTAGENGATAGTNAMSDYLITIPESASNTGEGLLGDPGYTITIRATLVWASTFSPEEFGNVAFNIAPDDSEANRTFTGSGIVIEEEPSGQTELTIDVEFDSSFTGSLNFRDTGLVFDVDLNPFDEDKRLAEAAPRTTFQSDAHYSTPNKSVVSTKTFLDAAATVYDKGIEAAGKVATRRDVGKIRKAARALFYAQTVAATGPDSTIAKSDLVQGATVNGISAFSDQVDQVAADLSSAVIDANETIIPAGPTVAFQTATPEVTNASFTGDPISGGAFEIDLGFAPVGPLTIANGVVLGSGRVRDIEGSNDTSSNQTVTGGGSDPDLEALPTIDNETNDAASLEFDLAVPEGVTSISFRYIFGSEEYNEFTGSSFNDVFAFFINGENVATVPDPENPVDRAPASINTVNHGQQGQTTAKNPQLFVNNDPHDGELVTVDPQNPPGPGIGFDPSETSPGEEPFPTEMDGFTIPLKITAPVESGETNSVKIAIADVGDAIYDSWVLVAAEDITSDESQS